ncbi:MoaD/ThiS family protein [uncultured Cohaesibacter sp.]|uniref:MoaD/ThiS family protein n=1 Tax=uncultured Cohaesibacter sp. TaxID=1002546 RepID=UPI0029C8DAA5|nr:MoaD/ThiS family protein [uncultured Cohaesibacter sp.]
MSTETMTITIRCFGAFRAFGEEMELTVARGTTVADLREPLLEAMRQADQTFAADVLLDSSRVATETELLTDAAPLVEGMRLAIIPPVSGG